MADKGSVRLSTDDIRALRQRLTGLALLPLTLFPILSIHTYSWRDISWLQSPPNHPPANLIGIAGAWSTFAAYTLFGLATWALPPGLLLLSLALLLGRIRRPFIRLAWTLPLLIGLCGWLQMRAESLATLLGPDGLNLGPNAGGLVGFVVTTLTLEPLLGVTGAGILLALMLLTGLAMTPGPRAWAALATGSIRVCQRWRLARLDRSQRLDREHARVRKTLAAERKRTARESRKANPPTNATADAIPPPTQPTQPAPTPGPLVTPAAPAKAALGTSPQAAPETPAATAFPASYTMPSLDLLDPDPDAPPGPQADAAALSRIIRDTLGEFGLQVEVTHVERGPVVTRYELLPAPGIRVERIAALANTLELTLKATSVRVQAPIPGKGVVGVEVPNAQAQTVTVRQVLAGKVWQEGKAEIPLVLGQDVGGNDLVLDLARVPHLLIAGATGSGKSVCINAMLAGLLMSRTPEQLRLMLIDPKIVEFAVFAELPHLVVPIITDPKKVSIGLRWAIVEMERRYKLLAKAGVRNIAAFNRREPVVQTDMFETEPAADAEPDIPERLPYIVIVIDELADLMLTAGPEIENSVARLAQLSRAVGIHMILATQRPSVNVITGTIKANFPGRVAFQVAQKVDSRTILDAGGAETLIGRGDMLFLNPWTSKLTRAQGALIQDHEIQRVVAFIREQTRPAYVESVYAQTEAAGDDSGGGNGETAGDEAGDDEPLLTQAVDIIRETRRASTSALQRRLRIGYNRAARLMDALEQRGIVGPPRGSDPREILVDLDPGIPDTDDMDEAADEPESDRENAG